MGWVFVGYKDGVGSLCLGSRSIFIHPSISFSPTNYLLTTAIDFILYISVLDKRSFLVVLLRFCWITVGLPHDGGWIRPIWSLFADTDG